MKKPTMLFLALGLFAVAAFAQNPPDKPTKPDGIGQGVIGIAGLNTANHDSREDITALTKERDDAKAQAAAVPQLQQQIQYLQILAERNELAVRVLQLTNQLNDAQRALQDAQRTNETLQRQLDAARPSPTPAKK